MKFATVVLGICAGILLPAALAVGQKADDQNLIAIERALADNPTSGRQATAVAKQYIYDGTVTHLTNFGRLRSMPKKSVLESYMKGLPFVFPSPDDLMNNPRDPSDPSKPDPSDPHVKTTEVSDLHADVYGDTALVSYNMTNTDTGNKDPKLNSVFHSGCLDTFVKRDGQWYLIGNACAPTIPFPQSVWDARCSLRQDCGENQHKERRFAGTGVAPN
jgi:hypothetical protein